MEKMRSAKIAKTGNSATVRLTQDVLQAAGFEIGRDVRVEAERGRITISSASDAYEATRNSARRMAGRYAKALELFGK